MVKFDKIYGAFFFLIWLGISGGITFLFGKGVLEEIQRGGSPWMGFILLFPLCFVMIGVWGLITSLKPEDPEPSPNLPGFPKQQKSKTEFEKSTAIGAFLFGLPFFLAGMGVIIFLSLVPTARTLMAYQWAPVPAKIISNTVKTNHDADGNTYKADVTFEYSYDLQTYTAKTYDFMNFSTGGYKSIRKKINAAPAGSTQTAYVNPNKPQEAVLSRRLSWIYLFTFLFGSIFAAVGGAIIFGTLTGGPKGNIHRRTLPKRKIAHGPVRLKPKSGGPMVRFIGILIFTIIWNGVVVILFVKDAPILFKIVFPFFGVITIVATIHSCLALFNPRPELEAATDQIGLGESFNLRWSIKGKTNQIEHLTIKLIGQEEATYRRGTDTRTDRHIFHEGTVADYPAGIQINTGNHTVNVPRETMHSWDSANNKIVWLLKINGTIAKWPDINEEYTITVLPFE